MDVSSAWKFTGNMSGWPVALTARRPSVCPFNSFQASRRSNSLIMSLSVSIVRHSLRESRSRLSQRRPSSIGPDPDGVLCRALHLSGASLSPTRGAARIDRDRSHRSA